MEPLTHTLAGYMTSRAGVNRWCPHGTPLLLLAVNAPDIDFLSGFGGPLAILEIHRGWTHALPVAPAVALLPLVALRIARRRTKWARAYVVALAGVLIHLLLDWTNIYGVRLLAPLDDEFFHLDIAPVVDLWVLGALALAAGWLALARLVSSEIGARQSSGRGVAACALGFLAVWQMGRFLLHERAAAVLESRMYDGAEPLRVLALPRFANPLRWTGVVETGEAYRIFEVDLTARGFDPAAGRTFYKPEPSPAIEAARRTDTFERFLRFARYPLWRVLPAEEPEGGFLVQAMDVRFGFPGRERFLASVLLDAALRVRQESFQFDPPGGGPRIR